MSLLPPPTFKTRGSRSTAVHCCSGFAQSTKIAKEDHQRMNPTKVQSVREDLRTASTMASSRGMYHNNPRSAKEMVFEPATIK